MLPVKVIEVDARESKVYCKFELEHERRTYTGSMLFPNFENINEEFVNAYFEFVRATVHFSDSESKISIPANGIKNNEDILLCRVPLTEAQRDAREKVLLRRIEELEKVVGKEPHTLYMLQYTDGIFSSDYVDSDGSILRRVKYETRAKHIFNLDRKYHSTVDDAKYWIDAMNLASMKSDPQNTIFDEKMNSIVAKMIVWMSGAGMKINPALSEFTRTPDASRVCDGDFTIVFTMERSYGVVRNSLRRENINVRAIVVLENMMHHMSKTYILYR